MMTARGQLRENVLYSHSWGNTLKVQKSALRWDLKRAMKDLCTKLSDLGEECFVVTANTSNGWVGHIGTVRGEEFIDENTQLLYDFLNYCRESQEVIPDNKKVTYKPDREKYEGNQSQTEPDDEETEKKIRICNVLTTLGDKLDKIDPEYTVEKTLIQLEKLVPLSGTKRSSCSDEKADTAKDECLPPAAKRRPILLRGKGSSDPPEPNSALPLFKRSDMSSAKTPASASESILGKLATRVKHSQGEKAFANDEEVMLQLCGVFADSGKEKKKNVSKNEQNFGKVKEMNVSKNEQGSAKVKEVNVSQSEQDSGKVKGINVSKNEQAFAKEKKKNVSKNEQNSGKVKEINVSKFEQDSRKEKEKTVSKDEQYPCLVCFQVLETKIALHKHLETQKHKLSVNVDVRLGNCLICGVSGFSREQMKVHIRSCKSKPKR